MLHRAGIMLLCLASIIGGAWWLKNMTADAASDIRAVCPSAEDSCLSTFFADTAVKDGLQQSFAMIEAWYDAEKSFRPTCTAFTRVVGNKIAEQVRDYKKLVFTPETVTCDYRVLQGYLEAMLKRDGDTEAGAKFCAYVGEALDTKVPDIRVECYRNLGRTLPFIRPSLLGDAPAMAGFATRSCKALARTSEELNRCVQGAFSSLSIETAARRYGLTPSADSLVLCRDQPTEFKQYCLKNTVKGTIINSYATSTEDIGVIIADLERKFPDLSPETLPEMVWVTAYGKGAKSVGLENAAERFIPTCGALPAGLRHSCVSGYALGIAKSGTPRQQYQEISAYCAEVGARLSLPPDTCLLPYAMTYLKGIYAPELMDEACALFKKDLGFDCAKAPYATSTTE